MKKLTAYIFIVLANVVLLAHAVLPHHHHEQQICSECTHCHIDELAQIHNTSDQNHSHDENRNVTSCVLKQAVIIPSAQKGVFKHDNDSPDSQKHNDYFLAAIGNNESQPISVTVATVTKVFTFLFSSVTTSPGLRAPPIV